MAYSQQQIVSRQDWSDNIFSFKTTRPEGFDFDNGQFVTLGLRAEKKLIPRAYSIVSTRDEELLEFLSIAVPDGPLTSRLVQVSEGSEIWINDKSTGSLTMQHIQPGRNLYMIATGTGIAPFVSLLRAREIFSNYKKVILVHSVRYCNGLAFRGEMEALSQENDQFVYFPTVTREAFTVNERGANLFCSGELSQCIGLDAVDPAHDRVMLCGNPEMNREVRSHLEENNWKMSDHKGVGNFTVEQAFVLAR